MTPFVILAPFFGIKVPLLDIYVPLVGLKVPLFGIRMTPFGTLVPFFGIKMPPFGAKVPNTFPQKCVTFPLSDLRGCKCQWRTQKRGWPTQ